MGSGWTRKRNFLLVVAKINLPTGMICFLRLMSTL